jgi:hypothetical protein
MVRDLTYDTFDINNPATNNPILIDEVNPPLLVRKTSMVIGVSWGSFGTLRREWLSQPASIEESYLSRTFTMLGVESVTVRDTSYNNCIRIHNNTDIPVSPYPSKSVQWYCEGFGLVKTVSSSSTQIFDGTTLVTSVKTTVLELVATKP